MWSSDSDHFVLVLFCCSLLFETGITMTVMHLSLTKLFCMYLSVKVLSYTYLPRSISIKRVTPRHLMGRGWGPCEVNWNLRILDEDMRKIRLGGDEGKRQMSQYEWIGLGMHAGVFTFSISVLNLESLLWAIVYTQYQLSTRSYKQKITWPAFLGLGTLYARPSRMPFLAKLKVPSWPPPSRSSMHIISSPGPNVSPYIFKELLLAFFPFPPYAQLLGTCTLKWRGRDRALWRRPPILRPTRLTSSFIPMMLQATQPTSPSWPTGVSEQDTPTLAMCAVLRSSVLTTLTGRGCRILTWMAQLIRYQFSFKSDKATLHLEVGLAFDEPHICSAASCHVPKTIVCELAAC